MWSRPPSLLAVSPRMEPSSAGSPLCRPRGHASRGWEGSENGLEGPRSPIDLRSAAKPLDRVVSVPLGQRGSTVRRVSRPDRDSGSRLPLGRSLQPLILRASHRDRAPLRSDDVSRVDRDARHRPSPRFQISPLPGSQLEPRLVVEPLDQACHTYDRKWWAALFLAWFKYQAAGYPGSEPGRSTPPCLDRHANDAATRESSPGTTSGFARPKAWSVPTQLRQCNTTWAAKKSGYAKREGNTRPD